MSGAGPSLHPGDWPSRAVLKFPPDAAPPPIPPPWNGEATIASPFPIPTQIYQDALSYKVPLTIATVYFVTTTFLNWYNRQHGNKPWPISKTRAFKAFVIAHNLFLAVYSAVTFIAMIRCLKVSFPHYSEPNAVVATVDSLCKIHGPRGLGDAVIYHSDNSTWSSLNSNIHLSPQGLPDETDVGRIWNEGLAFWGWWFYLSKFYEVVDTAILIVKGKRSSTLQKYHHAGAMLSMWAGMRYMSPPIWTFTTVNSFIHALMYTYYTLSALGYRVPNAIKRTLTTMQIMQFLLGQTFAAIHLFVSYTVPVSVAHKITEKVSIPAAASTVSSAVSSATSSIAAALPTATGGAALALFRKLIYRAAGDEGLAENIAIPGAPTPIHQQQHVAAPHVEHQNPIQKLLSHRYEDRIVYRTEYQTVPCIDTSAQAFAIYLNLIYLAPLTLLFMRFFFKSYLRSPAPKGKGQPPSKRRTVSDAAGDASRAVEREFDAIDKTAEDGISSAVNRARDAVRGRKTGANGHIKDERIGSLSPANKKFVDDVKRKVNQKLAEIDEGAQEASNKARQFAKEVINGTEKSKSNIKDSWQDVKKEVEPVAEKTKEAANHAGEAIKQEVDENDNRPQSSSSAKSPRKRNKKNKQNNQQSNSAEEFQNLDDSAVAQPEKEPEPKDINNTLDKEEGKGLF